MSEEHYPRQAKVTVTSVSIPSWFEVAASDAMTGPRCWSRVSRYAPDQGFKPHPLTASQSRPALIAIGARSNADST